MQQPLQGSQLLHSQPAAGTKSVQASMRRILKTQRHAFLGNGPRPLAERRADLAKLAAAAKAQSSGLAEAISADFGNRSRYET